MNILINRYVRSNCTRTLRKSVSTWTLNGRPVFASRYREYSQRHGTQDGRPFRMAVIGSGPAGFYTAYKVMSKIDNTVVDMYEQLPVPYGLVRFGVAPDHPEVKNCQDKFEEVAESPNFNFIGNISIGNGPSSIPLSTIASNYDAVLFSYGASTDRNLGIEGEDLKGIYSARAFVGWYNGLPEYADLAPDLLSGEEAVVVGQGNVALDVARILLSDVDVLRKTDISDNALEYLSKSRVKNVRVVGRRGPIQASFTIKEVRELMKLPSVSFPPVDPELLPADLKTLPRPMKRLMEVVQKGSPTLASEASRSWSLDFLLTPSKFVSKDDKTSLAKMILNKNTYIDAEKMYTPGAKIQKTDETVELDAQLCFKSIGYRSEAIPGMEDLNIPFLPNQGIVQNDHQGRVVSTTIESASISSPQHVPGMYCAGWVKRGPTGVIASTMADAFATADAITEDWHAKKVFLNPNNGPALGWENIRAEAEKKGCRRISWEDWKKIDGIEKARGKEQGRERVKFTNVEEMLAVVD